MSANLYTVQFKTAKDSEFINITDIVQAKVNISGVAYGIATIFSPHTTAGITINENADPDVVRDLLFGLDRIYPVNGNYTHYEGNSHAHLKASSMGVSQTVIIESGKLLLGTWQGIYFCEFDGPRDRTLFIKIVNG